MIQIAVCDDEELIRDALKSLIEDAGEKNHLDVKVSVFNSGSELLKCAEQFQMIFLDIEMPEMDGIDVGKCLMHKNPECRIVMATGKTERYKEVFQFHAYRFVTKPFQLWEIEEALVSSQREQLGNRTIEVYRKRTECQLMQKDIRYIYSVGSFVELVVNGQTFRKNMSLVNVEAMLEKEMFFKIHRQTIVNMFWIEGYQDGKVYMGDAEFEVSRRKKKTFERAYMEFDVKYR